MAQRFNQILSSIRQVVERAIRLLKGRWRKLSLLELLDIELMVHLIMTACVLHNFCILHDDFDENYSLHNDDSGDDGCVGLDGCAPGGPGGPGGVRLVEANRIQLMNIVC